MLSYCFVRLNIESDNSEIFLELSDSLLKFICPYCIVFLSIFKPFSSQMSMSGYFDVLTPTPARTLLERLRKKNLR